MSWRLNHPEYLVGYWPLNNYAQDVSGYGNHGTFTGTEAYVEGPWGHSVGSFNGSRYITTLKPLIPSGAWSISVFVNIPSAPLSTTAIFGQYVGGANGRVIMTFDATGIGLQSE